MAELRTDQVFGLVDLATMSLKDIAELDDAKIDKAVETLLPPCAGIGTRMWQNT